MTSRKPGGRSIHWVTEKPWRARPYARFIFDILLGSARAPARFRGLIFSLSHARDMLIISSFTFVLPSCLPTGGSSHPIRLLKGRKVPMTFLKKYWTFQRAIDAYDPVETSVFPYKSFGTVPLF